ncbi:MAG: GNAT family N-acetyltransferase [Solirubrobacterales bacterium]
MSVPIRAAGAEDAADVAGLLHDFNIEFGDFTPGVEALTANARRMLETGEMTVLLAGQGPDALAELRFRASVWSEKLDAYLEELYVAPALRGQGIGRALLDATMEEARSRGAGHIDLNTSVDDTAAIALYESAGFTNCEGNPDGPSMIYYEREL